MTYSRSETNERKRSQRRRRARFLWTVNSVLLAAIIVLVGIWWMSRDEGERSLTGQEPTESAAASEGAMDSPDAEPEPEPSESVPADVDEEEQETAASGDPDSGDPDGAIKLAFVGDILPASRVLDLMKRNGYDYPYIKARSTLEAADIAAGNLETPITERGTPAEDKQYVFRGVKESLPALKEAGFDFLSLANNHTLDYGWDGLSDTMDALDDVDLQHAGSGIDDKEAYSAAYLESKGKTVAFVSLTRVVPEVGWKADRNHPGVAEAYSKERAVAAIEEAKSHADLVVVMVHWGEERNDKPVAHQTDLAHAFVDAGADLVVGSHPHVLQGFEAYKGKWIAYSLGNFVFTSTANSKTSETGVLTATCGEGGECSLSFEPMFAVDSQPAPMEAEAGKALLAQLSSLSFGAQVREDGTIVAQD